MDTIYTARNGARYIKLANGQCRFISGASNSYLNQIRPQKGGATLKSGIYYFLTSLELDALEDYIDVDKAPSVRELTSILGDLDTENSFRIRENSEIITDFQNNNSLKIPFKFTGSEMYLLKLRDYLNKKIGSGVSSLGYSWTSNNKIKSAYKIKINRLKKNKLIAIYNMDGSVYSVWP